MNTGYLIYQAERPLSRAEQRRVDIARGELAQAVSRRWQALTAPLRWTGRPARHQAGYPAAGRLAECQAGECLTGRAA